MLDIISFVVISVGAVFVSLVRTLLAIYKVQLLPHKNSIESTVNELNENFLKADKIVRCFKGVFDMLCINVCFSNTIAT